MKMNYLITKLRFKVILIFSSKALCTFLPHLNFGVGVDEEVKFIQKYLVYLASS